MALQDAERIAAQWIGDSVATQQAVAASAALRQAVVAAAARCAECCRGGGKVLFAGNGGSAADAQHMAGEFVGRFFYDRPGLGAIALTVDASVMTAVANDYGFGYVYERQVEALGRPGDVFVGYSTSGNSENVVRAALRARALGLYTIAFTGSRGGRLAEVSDLALRAPSDVTPRIQEAHLLLGHVLCGLVEAELFPKTA